MPELPAAAGPWLVERAQRDPGGVALRAGSETLAWADLAGRVETIAGRLVALGLAPGDRLAVLMEPSVRLVEIIHAAQRSGVTLVLLNTRLVPRELAPLLAHAEPSLVLHDSAHEATLRAPGHPVPFRRLEAVRALDAVAAVPLPPPSVIDPDAVQTILYTSGTTGRSKGVMLTHGNHRASAVASRAHLGSFPGDRWLCALPLHHVGGLSIVMRSVLDGTPLVLQPRFDAAAVWSAIQHEDVTLLSLVPTMLHRLLAHAGGALTSGVLRAVLVGGAALAPELYVRARASGLPVVPTYGLTETASQVATAPLGAVSDAAGWVGGPLPGTHVRIADADPEGRGEVLVAGPTVMAGYFRDPGATATAIVDAWLHTGDVGRLDDAGGLQIFDRRTDVVITGGENVYPSEVEAVLQAHPAIADAGVYGIADPEWGRLVQAAVVVRPGGEFDEAELMRWCRDHLAGYKVPRCIRRVAALPRTASGKLQRYALVP